MRWSFLFDLIHGHHHALEQQGSALALLGFAPPATHTTDLDELENEPEDNRHWSASLNTPEDGECVRWSIIS